MRCPLAVAAGPKECETVQDQEIPPSPPNCTNLQCLEGRFSATLGQDPEIELALV